MNFPASFSIALLMVLAAPVIGLTTVDRAAVDSCDPPPEQPKKPPKK